MAEATNMTTNPLLVSADTVGDLADRLTGWYLFPVEWDSDDTVAMFNKAPIQGVHWQTHAATGREDVISLWRRFGGFNEDGTPRTTRVAVACDPSGIFVVDEDRDWRSDEASPNDPDWKQWELALDSCDSLVLTSSTKGRPHYYFRQPTDGKGRVAERIWPAGEVKSRGYVVLSAADPIYQPSGTGPWSAADVKEAIPPLVDLIGRRRHDSSSSDAHYGQRVTKEEFYQWLTQEPGEHFGGRLISAEHEERFITQLVEKFRKDVEQGKGRRNACLATVHIAVIESYQGLYSLEAAHDAILDAYEEMRTYGPGDVKGTKGWTPQRADDFRGMWETEIHKPDALRSAEESYEELSQRLSASGLPTEISDEDREDDAYLMDLIMSATAEPTPEAKPKPAPAPAPSSTTVPVVPEPITDPEPESELSWDGVADAVPPPAPKPEPIAPSKSPVNLHPDAQRGVLWDLASGLIGKHELPHVALMITLAGWSGAVLGSAGAGAIKVSGDRHGPELCVCMVGTSAVSHKSGTVSFGHMVFNEWIDIMETGVSAPGLGAGYFREVQGIESGQAFIEVWPTAAEIAGGEGIGRSVMMVEKELTTMWKKAARKGSTIPEEIRKAWDGDMLAVRGVRAGNHRVRPENYRFSAVGATIHSLAARTIVESGADISGDGNRWLWCWGQEVADPVKSNPSFEEHPLVLTVRNQVKGVINSVERARQEGWWPGSAMGPGGLAIVEFSEPSLWWTAEADQAWLADDDGPNKGTGVYADLRNELKTEAPGSHMVKGMKGRGAQQVMRLAIGYEMLKAGDGWASLVRNGMRNDGQSWCLSLEALRWASAVWRYCADTVEHLFSDTTGNDQVDELVSAIREIARDQGKKFNGFILKTDVVGQGFSKNKITALLAEAEAQGAIWTGTLQREGRGGQPPVVIGLPKWTPPAEIVKRKR